MKRTCNCPEPPGGSVTCDEGQVAYCKVVAGRPTTGCLTPPPEDVYVIRSPERELAELLRWVLKTIDVDLSLGVFEQGSTRALFEDFMAYPRWFTQIRDGTPLHFVGGTRSAGEPPPWQVRINVPEKYGDPRLVVTQGLNLA
ncbi:MAG: hypothetical protein HOQ32_01955 [Lysobacter sp.]|nr:hypothetical protein [Lysobacter sp.]